MDESTERVTSRAGEPPAEGVARNGCPPASSTAEPRRSGRPAVLAAALLSIELVAAMQQFLTATVLPMIAEQLGGRSSYGVATGAPLVATFLTLPLGAALMRRHSPARLLTWLTPVTILGGVVAALAPTMAVFVLGRVITGLAAGALAGVSMGAIVTGLPESWRRRVLALYNVVWVVASLIGPGYAGAVSHQLGWRWSLVLYLPLLLAARLVVARQLPHRPQRGEDGLPLADALLVALGVGLLVAVPLRSGWAVLSVALGLLLIWVAGRRLLPTAALRARPGAGAAIALLGLACASWMGASSVVAIVGHDRLHLGPALLGVLIGTGGLGWALTGLLCGFWPLAGRRLVRRVGWGFALLGLGLVGMAPAAWFSSGPGLIAGWVCASLGMGLSYLDAMNASFEPDSTDPIRDTDAAAAVVLVEQVTTAVAMSLATGALAGQPAAGPWVFGALAAPALLALGLVARLARAT